MRYSQYDQLRKNDLRERPEGVRHVSREWRVVQAPVEQVVVLCVEVPVIGRVSRINGSSIPLFEFYSPFFHGKRSCNFHPVSLRLKVSVHGGRVVSRVAPQTHCRSQKQGDSNDAAVATARHQV